MDSQTLANVVFLQRLHGLWNIIWLHRIILLIYCIKHPYKYNYFLFFLEEFAYLPRPTLTPEFLIVFPKEKQNCLHCLLQSNLVTFYLVVFFPLVILTPVDTPSGLHSISMVSAMTCDGFLYYADSLRYLVISFGSYSMVMVTSIVHHV